MRFERVWAKAFGPFRDETIEFAPGMNVVHGPNEAGKSSWHAALYLGLCGMRRRRGRPAKDEQPLIDKHRPWHGDEWKVSVVVALDDGRRVEIVQDLDRRVESVATDLELGRDVSDEIMNEGSPDGARWLGLDRKSFLAVACVRQADILAILSESDSLQEHLQRAAAATEEDATAAAAIKRLRKFRSDAVGQDDGRPTKKPMAIARQRVDQARRALDDAKVRHKEFIELEMEAEAAARDAEKAERSLRTAAAAEARRQARAVEARLRQAGELMVDFPDGEPPSLGDDDRLARRVTAALREWHGLPDIPELPEGKSSEDLRQELEALPPEPEGDLLPAEEVTRAYEELTDARRRLQLHEQQRPEEPSPARRDTTAEELLALAAELDRPVPGVDPAVEEQERDLLRRLEDSKAKTSWKSPAVLVGVALAVAGVPLLLLMPPLGLVMVIAAVVLVVRGMSDRGEAERLRLFEELQQVQATAARQRSAQEEALRRKEEARARLHALGIVPESAAVRAEAERIARARRDADAYARWQEIFEQLRSRLSESQDKLAALLRARGVAVEGSPEEAFRIYSHRCEMRAAQAEAAARRVDLERQLQDRLAAEEARAEAVRRRQRAETELKEVARLCGIAGGDDDLNSFVRALEDWEEERQRELERLQELHERWARLQALLGGEESGDLHRRFRALEEEAREAAERADELAQGLDLQRVEEMAGDPDLDRTVEGLRQEANQARDRAASLRGMLEERRRDLPSVPEAEEELSQAEAELARLESLRLVLETTIEFLEQAQERIHRDVAPVLAQALRRNLPALTGGRYVEATVDPKSLRVRVKTGSGHYRDAEQLSHGTTEQVYMLLRTALADHLSRSGETCPLILDDPTAQWDRTRTEAFLDLLLQISGDRQVILFSQEEEVLAWARGNLSDPDHRLIELAVVPA
ncbi:MAG: hypothetical protein KatS3mg008_0167 [Acidimicrobiales bacterium]|nr:MAG: hypothetical protein KatS3mg008_0167 [Acidimicrobiales bacterium]